MHRAFLSAVPYEALAVQLGEAGPLDPAALVRRTLRGGRGGYCFEINTVLLTLLEGLGFAVQRREAIVGAREAAVRGEPTNHLAAAFATTLRRSFGIDPGALGPERITRLWRRACAQHEAFTQSHGAGRA